VKIEWHEEGKRRSRTIGENTAEVRRHADEALQEILEVFEPAPVPARLSSWAPPESMEQALRGVALSLLDVADQVAEVVTTFGSELAYRLRKPPVAEESVEPEEE
jgi:hypothetical protein